MDRALLIADRMRLVVLANFVLATLWPLAVEADVVQLRSGGTVRGVVQNARAVTADEPLVIETLTGGELELATSEVTGVDRRSRQIEEYHSLTKQAADTVEARWELAEWCKRSGLIEPRREQLRRIVELDPNHKLSRQGLGHTWKGNRWVSPEQIDSEMRQAGYVKHKGEWITTLELEQMQADGSRLQKQKLWVPKIRLWVKRLGDREPKLRTDAVVRFRELRDPDAIPAIVDTLLNTANVERRSLAVQTLAQIEGSAAVQYLAQTALSDADASLRKTAFRALSEPQRTAAAPLFERALTSEENWLVRRAAFLLGEVGLKSAIPALIEALITSHKTSVAVQQPISGSFDRNGNPNPQSSVLPPDIDRALRAGQLPQGVQVQQSGPQPPVKVVTVRQSVQNSEVLDVLRKLTAQDFGFNETAWRTWWRSQPR